MESVLVTGGAGYIGSHTVKRLIEKGFDVAVLDDLSTGHRESVLTELFYEGDIADQHLVTEIIKKHHVTSVIHFAAKSLVGESVLKPDYYFESNVAKTNKLLSALVQNHVKKIVFSSTAAVYGHPTQMPIPEDEKTIPINPYGESKLMVEKALAWMEKAYDLKWCALRYFNAAGADLEGGIGEDHNPETHLIPLVLQTALGLRGTIHIFGTDYTTPDGTCIRDYIHVMDLAEAHILALQALENGMKSQPLNVGTGAGFSVKEIIQTAEGVVGQKIKQVESDRREGDPAKLVAKTTRIQKLLQWKPAYSSLDTILESAWKWHKSHPNGYEN